MSVVLAAFVGALPDEGAIGLYFGNNREVRGSWGFIHHLC